MPCDTCFLGHFARRYLWQQLFDPLTSPNLTFESGQVNVSSRSGQIFKLIFYTKYTCFLIRISSGIQICHQISRTMRRTSENCKSKNGVINFSLNITKNFHTEPVFVCDNFLLIQNNHKVVLTPLSHQDESNDIQLDTVSKSLTLSEGQICIGLRPNLKVTF